MSDSPSDFLYSNEAVMTHRYPFCSGSLEPKSGNMKCAECHANFEYDDWMECVFVDTSDLRLPVHGTVCPQCGLVQGEDGKGCLYCGKEMCCDVQ
jgi:hypothetical protein